MKTNWGDFPGDSVVTTLPSMWVQSLVGEQRFHVPRGQNTKTKQTRYCNKFNTDFKKGPPQKKKKKLKNKRPIGL